MKLIMIRHGLPERVETQDGTPADPGLSQLGERQARRVAAWLAPETIDRIYVSPLKRAQQTASPLAESKNLKPDTETRIAEFDAESNLYVPLEELRRTDYEAWRTFMKTGYPADVDVVGFCQGVVDGMEDIIASNRGHNVAIVCHGGVINAWAAHVMGMDFKLFFAPDYTSVNRFLAAGSGERSLESLNETSHLRDL